MSTLLLDLSAIHYWQPVFVKMTALMMTAFAQALASTMMMAFAQVMASTMVFAQALASTMMTAFVKVLASMRMVFAQMLASTMMTAFVKSSVLRLALEQGLSCLVPQNQEREASFDHLL
ncbi:MAG: hypothetical protein M3Y39_15050 [Chloroflexota bacterium]|nr:hypothetical protein [Chloroflexota bacterium]